MEATRDFGRKGPWHVVFPFHRDELLVSPNGLEISERSSGANRIMLPFFFNSFPRLSKFPVLSLVKIANSCFWVNLSQGFKSNIANVELTDGRWYYEVTLFSSNLFQNGFAPAGSDFLTATNGNGTGDDIHSFAFDGQRVLAWNGDSKPFGQRCSRGDVVGFYIDLTRSSKGRIGFTRNGVDLGIAFENVLDRMKETKQKSLSPSVSCDWMHHARANFGATPFKYSPPLGFLAIEIKANISNLVLNYWDRKGSERNLLNAAVEEGNLEALTAFIKDFDEMDVNSLFQDATSRSAKRNRKNLVSNKEISPLLLASICNRPEMVQLLFKHGFKLQGDEIHWASFSGAVDVLPVLIANGATVNGWDQMYRSVPIFFALLGGHASTFNYLRTHGANLGSSEGIMGNHLLHLAATAGLIEAMELILDANPDCLNQRNTGGEKALTFAVLENRVEATRFLLARGASVKIEERRDTVLLQEACLREDSTILRLLVEAGLDVNAKVREDSTILRLLVEAGLNVNAKEDYRGYFAIHLAAHLGYTEPVRYLLTLPSVNVNTPTTTDGVTALHLAAKKYQETTKLLLDNNANINFMARNGTTPLHLAVGHLGNTKMLLERGSKIISSAGTKIGLQALGLSLSPKKERVLKIESASIAGLSRVMSIESTSGNSDPLEWEVQIHPYVGTHFGVYFKANLIEEALQADPKLEIQISMSAFFRSADLTRRTETIELEDVLHEHPSQLMGRRSWIAKDLLVDPKNGFIHSDKTLHFVIEYQLWDIKLSESVYDDGSDEEENEEENEEGLVHEAELDFGNLDLLRNLSDSENQNPELKALRKKHLIKSLKNSSSPLHYAAKENIPGVVAALVAHPGSREFLNAMDLGLTPLQALQLEEEPKHPTTEDPKAIISKVSLPCAAFYDSKHSAEELLAVLSSEEVDFCNRLGFRAVDIAVVRKSKDVLRVLLDRCCSVAHIFPPPSDRTSNFESKYSLLYSLNEFQYKVNPCPLFNLAAQDSNLETLTLLLGHKSLPIHISTESPFDFCVFSKPIIESGVREAVNHSIKVPPSRPGSDLSTATNGLSIAFVLGSRTFWGSEEVMKAHCDYFQALFSSSMKEAREHLVRISDDWNEDAVELFLRYLHSGSAILADPKMKTFCSSVEFIASTMALSKQYFSPAFEIFCEDLLRTLLDEENLEEVFNFAEEIDSKRLRVFCLDFAFSLFAKDPAEGPLASIVRSGLKEILAKHFVPIQEIQL